MKTNSLLGLGGLLLFAAIGLYGCSDANNESPAGIFPHPEGWTVATTGGLHPAAYQANQSICVECHGSAQDPNSSGGSSGVSCFSSSRSGIVCHPAGPSGHPAGWEAPGSHGAAAKAAVPGLNSCSQCHGADFTGGAGQSCKTCHTTAPHPVAPWRGTTASGTTHTTTDTGNAAECARCHLNNQRLTSPQPVPTGTTPGCFNNTLCHGAVSGHPAGWSAASSHGAAAKAATPGFNSCGQCHGSNFTGDSGPSCLTCHTTAPHPIAANWRAIGAVTHTNTGTNNAPVCSVCHNSSTPNLVTPYSAWFSNSPAGSFKGGSPDCFTASLCHGDVRKTSNCDACHSVATTAPFKSLSGATAASDAKVGAHVKHLSATVLSANIACSECHAIPGAPEVSGTHRNGTNNITFGPLAQTGSLTPVYTAASGSCTNTYCHGATLTGGGTSKVPVWNQPGVDCGTCHGNPPSTVRNGAAAHSSSSACNGCHTHVNSSNNGFTVAGAALHVNGSIDASAGGHNGAPYPGATHRSASTAECFGCHPANIAGSPYPATSGTPPNCRGCHLNADPSTDPHCSDCHGDLTTGRPDGSIFPNRQGEHRRSAHINRACTDCHPFTSGDLRHGWSDRQKSTAAQVGGAGTSIISWNSATKSCTPSCHGTETW